MKGMVKAFFCSLGYMERMKSYRSTERVCEGERMGSIPVGRLVGFETNKENNGQ